MLLIKFLPRNVSGDILWRLFFWVNERLGDDLHHDCEFSSTGRLSLPQPKNYLVKKEDFNYIKIKGPSLDQFKIPTELLQKRTLFMM